MVLLAVVAALVFSQARGDQGSVTLYEYDDGSGPRQVERLQDVPKKYRARAKPVSATNVDSPPVAPERGPASTAGDPRLGGRPPRSGSPAAAGAPRISCTWTASVRANVASCRNDSDCRGGGTCISGGCVKGGTRAAYSVGEVGGKQWTGSYSNSGDLASVRNECENHARSKAAEAEVSCSCHPEP